MRRHESETLSGGERFAVDGDFETLLAAARADAGWAFERLFRVYAPRVRGYLSGQGAVEADELVNDVFLAAFRSLGRFSGDEASFRSWLFTIARNRLIDERRRQARRGAILPGDVSVLHDAAGGDVEDEALANLGDSWVRTVLSQLAPDQRDVLLLRVVGDLTVAQIAEVLGKRVGAVKALQRRGLAASRRILQKQGVPLRREIDVVQD